MAACPKAVTPNHDGKPASKKLPFGFLRAMRRMHECRGVQGYASARPQVRLKLPNGMRTLYRSPLDHGGLNISISCSLTIKLISGKRSSRSLLSAAIS